MLKKLLPVLCTLSIASTNASTNWSTSSDVSPNIKMSVTTLVDGSVVPYVAVRSGTICNGGNREVSYGGVVVFNGTPVKVVEQCIAENIAAAWPATSKGRVHVIADMKSKSVLKVSIPGAGDFIFETKGFKEAYNAKQSESRVTTDAI